MPKTFEDLDVFKRALELIVGLYAATEDFPKREWYGLAAQLRRASVSVVSDIAEGEGRLTPGEWRLMLSHARGSLYEIEAQLIVAAQLGYLRANQASDLRAATRRVGRPLAGLIRYVQSLEGRRGQPATGNR